MPKVLNIMNITKLTRDAVYIGRPSKWGNPFKIDKDHSREQVINEFRKMVLADPKFVDEIRNELAGKDLVCFCHPKACHGDVLLEIANNKNIMDF